MLDTDLKFEQSIFRWCTHEGLDLRAADRAFDMFLFQTGVSSFFRSQRSDGFPDYTLGRDSVVICRIGPTDFYDHEVLRGMAIVYCPGCRRP